MTGPEAGWQIRSALLWSLSTMRRNILGFGVLAALVTAVQLLQILSLRPLNEAISACAESATPGQQAACADSLSGGALLAAVLTLLFAFGAIVVGVGVVRAALRATAGQEPGIDALVDGRNLGKFIAYQLVYSLAAGLGVLLCFFPGVIVIFFLQLGPFFVLDKGMKVGEALVASVRAIRTNVPVALVLAAVNVSALLLGGVLYGVLTLIVLPFASLFTAYLYRQFNGEPVLD